MSWQLNAATRTTATWSWSAAASGAPSTKLELPPEALEDAYRKLTRIDAPSLVERNRAMHRMLVDGITVEYRRKDGSIAAGRYAQLGAQVSPVGTPGPGPDEQVSTPGASPEELIIEIVSIGQHDDGGVRHRLMQDDSPRIEGHRETLPRSLCMPHHTDPTVARFTAWLMPRLVLTEGFCSAVLCRMPGCPQRFLDSYIHRMELMIARHLLDELSIALDCRAKETGPLDSLR